MCWKLHAPGKAHFPRFHERQMRFEAPLVGGLGGGWRFRRGRLPLAMSRDPGGGAAFFVGGVTVLRAQSSVVWSTSLQMAHGVMGASACDAMYAICRDGSSWSHFAIGPGLLRRKTWSYVIHPVPPNFCASRTMRRM